MGCDGIFPSVIDSHEDACSVMFSPVIVASAKGRQSSHAEAPGKKLTMLSGKDPADAAGEQRFKHFSFRSGAAPILHVSPRRVAARTEMLTLEVSGICVVWSMVVCQAVWLV